MNNLFEYEKEISKKYDEILGIHKSIFDSISNIELREFDITKAILKRMNSYYIYQQNLNDFYNRNIIPSGADFFTETVIFYLKVYFKLNSISYTIKSEVRISKKSIRPDISIWDGDQVVAIIECKTQFGWSSDTWESSFLNRELKLKEINSTAKVFLLVLTT